VRLGELPEFGKKLGPRVIVHGVSLP
jgi:hypothetical protein